MKIIAYYARTSTNRQEKEKTIDSQVAEIEEKVKSDGNVIGEGLRFEDDGWTGSILARPGLDALIEAVKTNIIKTVYVYDLGRLSRDFTKLLVLRDEFKESGVEIVSLHDINATTPEKELLQNVMGLFHEYERIKIAERMRRGKLYKSKNGLLFGWPAPYGYELIKRNKEKNESGEFKINEKEARIVRMIFKWVVNEQLTIRKVIKRLHDLKIRPQKSERGVWATSTLSRMLRDQSYIGTTHYNKREAVVAKNPHKDTQYKRVKKTSRAIRPKEQWHPIKIPAILDQELFDRVQEQLMLNRKFADRNSKTEYLVAKLLGCACGANRSGEGNRQKGIAYYRCNSRVNDFPLPPKCPHKGVNAVVLDNVVWNYFATFLTDPKLIQKEIAKWQNRQKNLVVTEHNDITDLKKELDALKNELSRYIKLYGQQLINDEQFKENTNPVRERIAIIEQETEKEQRESNTQRDELKVPNLVELCDRMSKIISDLSFDEKRQIVRALLDKVVTDGITATIKGYIPLQVKSEENKENVELWSHYRDCGAS